MNSKLKQLRKIVPLSSKRQWLLSAILVLFLGLAIWRQIRKPINESSSILVAFLKYLYYNLQMGALFCCVTVTNAKSVGMRKFIARMSEFNTKIKFSTSHIGGKWLLKHIFIKIIFQNLPYFCKINQKWNFFNFMDCAITNLSLLIYHLFLSQWIYCLFILKQHFKNLTAALNTISCHCLFPNFKKHNQMIRACGIIYDDLCTEAKKLNTLFSWQLLILIPTLFLLLMNYTFEILKNIKNSFRLDVSSIIFDILYLELLLELIVPCELVYKEVDEFVDVVHKMVDFEETDGIILLTNYQKIEFSACGVFSLNSSLIYTVRTNKIYSIFNLIF